MKKARSLRGLLSLSERIGNEGIEEYLHAPTEQNCSYCGQEYLQKFEVMNGRCENCRKKSLTQNDPGCGAVNCRHGWHFEQEGDCPQQWIAKEKCPFAIEAEATRKWDGGSYGKTQTFKTFDRTKELAAFDEAKDWATNATGRDILALIKSGNRETNTGCGKTHLLRAAGREMAKRGLWVEIITPGMVTDMVRARASFSERAEAAGRMKRWIACDVIIFDDIGREETLGPVSGALFQHVFDERPDKPMAFACNYTKEEFSGRYGEALASRFLGGARIPKMRGIDFRSK